MKEDRTLGESEGSVFLVENSRKIAMDIVSERVYY